MRQKSSFFVGSTMPEVGQRNESETWAAVAQATWQWILDCQTQWCATAPIGWLAMEGDWSCWIWRSQTALWRTFRTSGASRRSCGPQRLVRSPWWSSFWRRYVLILHCAQYRQFMCTRFKSCPGSVQLPTCKVRIRSISYWRASLLEKLDANCF